MYKVQVIFSNLKTYVESVSAGNWLLAQRKVIQRLIDDGYDSEGIIDIKVTLEGESNAN